VRLTSGYCWMYTQPPAITLLSLCYPLFFRLLVWGLITAIWRMYANQFELLIQGTLLIRKGYGTNNNWQQAWGHFLHWTPFVKWRLTWTNLSLDFLDWSQTLKNIINVDFIALLKICGVFLKIPTPGSMWLFKSLFLVRKIKIKFHCFLIEEKGLKVCIPKA